MVRRYLLDEMSDEERQTVEEKFLKDDNFFDEMVAFEDELYYDYQQNRLTARERSIFEQKFLQSRQDIERSEFANAFLETTAEIAGEKIKTKEDTASVSWWQSIAGFFNFSGSMMQYGMAAAVLLLTLGVIGLFIQNSRLQNEMAGLQNKQAQEKQEQEKILAEKQRQQTELEKQQSELEQRLAQEKSNSEQNEKRIQEIEAERTRLAGEIAETRRRINQIPQNPANSQKTPVSQPQPWLATLILLPGEFNRSNGEGMRRVNISPSVKNLQLRLLLKNKEDYKSYQTTVRGIGQGFVAWKSADLKPGGKGAKKSLLINLPAKNLQRMDYELTLLGVNEDGRTEEITSYYFSVVK